ncbi:MAG: Clp1/GlmU family protein [candidate division KSB1 bacterium]|nr:Clp1/GlmU family protein [candidate division KSB1 bacterium]
MAELQIPEDWRAAARQILSSPGVVAVLGGPDSGKSTFCTYLGRQAVDQGLRTALVDADVGQSRVGPPGCIGWAWFQSAGLGPEEDLWFVGSFSPSRHLTECVAGTFRLVMAALSRGAQMVIVDTTGLVRGRDGFQLKMAKLHCLRPNHVVVFRRDLQGTALLQMILLSNDWSTLLVDVPPGVRMRTREERRAYRIGLLQTYLARAEEEEFRRPTVVAQVDRLVPLEGREVLVRYPEPDPSLATFGGRTAEFEQRRLCALESEYGRCLGIGVLTDFDPWGGCVRVQWRRLRAGEVRLIRVSEVPLELLSGE